ncbi:NADP-dependent oxidoreductase [Sphingomonas fennica]|uniref:NADP-dependent oxidoreductase n=1 Tax=Edaphosphingomonas fennica TaxID=114404 RepID=A0A2T4I4E9_9SPHN|nr:NADP-dependent oxidoreductase [Sphingomonas fennica]PTD24287.1 NADP-dependent oxidoreductase [Sphingomonas fennica]
MPRAWNLIARPTGLPGPECFSLVETPPAPLADGEVRVRNTWLSVDPYMRGRMNDVKSYVPPFGLNEAMTGGAVGVVVESRADGLKPGDRVMHMLGWRDEAVGKPPEFMPLPDLGVPDQMFLGLLGITGLTAYFGLFDVAEAKAGDTVFVSAAAGAVGSAVVQFAKLKGMTVIGSAGGAEKCALVRDLGADAVIDYKADRPLVKQLAEAAPDGIDVYFDNVGGEHLDAALAVARNHGRFAMCGMIESYNTGAPLSLQYAIRIVGFRLQLRGFIISDYMHRMSEFFAEVGPWAAAGKLKNIETIRDGLEGAPDAFRELFSGGNKGKMVVRL